MQWCVISKSLRMLGHNLDKPWEGQFSLPPNFKLIRMQYHVGLCSLMTASYQHGVVLLKILHVSPIATLALQILYSIVACCTMITGTIDWATMPHLCPKMWSMKLVWAKFKPRDWSWSLKATLKLPTLSTYMLPLFNKQTKAALQWYEKFSNALNYSTTTLARIYVVDHDFDVPKEFHHVKYLVDLLCYHHFVCWELLL